MSDELESRLHRIYAAIKATKECDMAQLPAQVLRSEKVVGFFQDFTGNLTKHDMENAAHTVIHNIANLHDHVKRHVASGGGDKARVDDAFNSSMDLRVIKDLSNNDKHGYPPRRGGHSGRSPRLSNVRRQMRLTAKGGGGWVMMTLGPAGVPRIAGDGTGVAVITGDVVDEDGNAIGDLHEIELRAVKSWEVLLKELGVL